MTWRRRSPRGRLGALRRLAGPAPRAAHLGTRSGRAAEMASPWDQVRASTATDLARERLEKSILADELRDAEIPFVSVVATRFFRLGAGPLGLGLNEFNVVLRVEPESAAEAEGSLRPGDRIVAVNCTPVEPTPGAPVTPVAAMLEGLRQRRPTRRGSATAALTYISTLRRSADSFRASATESSPLPSSPPYSPRSTSTTPSAASSHSATWHRGSRPPTVPTSAACACKSCSARLV